MGFTSLCARGATDLMAAGSDERCGLPATRFEYGMARCAAHEIDLSPCVWEGNLDQSGHCRIDHAGLARFYGSECRNPRPPSS